MDKPNNTVCGGKPVTGSLFQLIIIRASLWNRWMTFPWETPSQVRGKHWGNYRLRIENSNEDPPSLPALIQVYCDASGGSASGPIDSPLPPPSLIQWLWRSMQHEGICVLIKAVCSADRYRPRPPTRFGRWRAAAWERRPLLKALQRPGTGHGARAPERQAVQSEEWQRSGGGGLSATPTTCSVALKETFCLTNWFDKLLLKVFLMLQKGYYQPLPADFSLLNVLVATDVRKKQRQQPSSNNILLVYAPRAILSKP